VVVAKAVGSRAGRGRLRTPGATSTIASLSPEWVAQVRASGRFREFEWTGEEPVEVTTLDELISEYGVPSFCKIDVEGFEAEVLDGLSTPIQALSFEFAREILETTEACLEKLAALGPYEFNHSPAESLTLAMATWTDAERQLRELERQPVETLAWGDVYARLARRS
jgi:FkbM family methyltransferase